MKKVLNIKMYDEDFEMIQIVITSHIARLQMELYDDLTNEDKSIIEQTILKEKMLIAKLKTCKLYNE